MLSVDSVGSEVKDADGVARTIVQVAVFAALIAALSILPGVPVGPVPITLQTLGVMLAGMLLGPAKGALAVGLYLLLLAIGLPVGSGMRGGPALFLGPTGGFLVGFLPAVALIGWLARHPMTNLAMRQIGRGRALTHLILACLLGSFAVYAVGVPVMTVVTGLDWIPALVSGMVIFLPGDLIKGVIAALITVAVVRALPNRFTGR